MRDDVRARTRAGSWFVGTAGFLVMLVSGVRSGPLLPNWQDPDDGLPCSFSSSGCPADVDAALRSLWWWSAFGGVLLVLAVAAHTWSLPPARESDRSPRVPAVVRAVCLGGGGAALCAAMGFGVLFVLIVSPHLVPVVLAAGWLVQAVVISGVEQTAGISPPRRAATTGLLSAAAATGTTAWFFFAAPGHWRELPLVDGAVLAAGVLAAAVLAAPWPARVRAAAGLLTVAAAAAVVVLAWTTAHRPVPEAAYRASGPAAPATSSPEPSPDPSPEPSPTPPPAATTAPPAPVAASVPCAADGLDWQVTGFDAALGARFAALVLTNTGSRACWVEGVPVVVLEQGGRPLDLAVTPDSSAGNPGRIGIAPGGTAFSQLSWRTYAGEADAVTPQSVRAALAGGTPVPVPVAAPRGHGPAPFDLADGGSWQVAAWAPGTG